MQVLAHKLTNYICPSCRFVDERGTSINLYSIRTSYIYGVQYNDLSFRQSQIAVGKLSLRYTEGTGLIDSKDRIAIKKITIVPGWTVL